MSGMGCRVTWVQKINLASLKKEETCMCNTPGSVGLKSSIKSMKSFDQFLKKIRWITTKF